MASPVFRRPVSRCARGGVSMTVLASFIAMLAGLGSRWGWWHFGTGFMILKWGVYVGLAAAAVSLVGCLFARPGGPRRGFVWAVLGLLTSLAVVGVPWSWLQDARRVPPIHDITTDTDNPPGFVAILPLRRNAPNPAEYGGPEIAAQQRAAYPDVQPVTLNVPPDQAFERALTAARARGWEIVEANSTAGRIEATDTTLWFGFKDDVVIRITPGDGGSRIDVRSVSRVGRSDAGTNARRIQNFLHQLKNL
ncbi:DUF1499 domain-containing protein [Nitrospira defluvii]|nr:DUF1499 domain-containing protein [Nitrospira defluvii]